MAVEVEEDEECNKMDYENGSGSSGMKYTYELDEILKLKTCNATK
jgi:hypothetical protein